MRVLLQGVTFQSHTTAQRVSVSHEYFVVLLKIFFVSRERISASNTLVYACRERQGPVIAQTATAPVCGGGQSRGGIRVALSRGAAPPRFVGAIRPVAARRPIVWEGPQARRDRCRAVARGGAAPICGRDRTRGGPRPQCVRGGRAEERSVSCCRAGRGSLDLWARSAPWRLAVPVCARGQSRGEIAVVLSRGAAPPQFVGVIRRVAARRPSVWEGAEPWRHRCRAVSQGGAALICGGDPPRGGPPAQFVGGSRAVAAQ